MTVRVRAMFTVWLIGAALASAGCRDSTSPRDDLARDLARREAEWDAAGVHDYAFDYHVDAMVISPPVRIEVRADTVARVVVLATGQEVPSQGWPTVDSLFAKAHDVIARDQYHPAISYDPQRGFPTKIAAPSNVPDTGFTLEVSNFVAGG